MVRADREGQFNTEFAKDHRDRREKLLLRDESASPPFSIDC